MKNLLRRLPRSKSKSRRIETASESDVSKANQEDLRVPRIDPADLKVCKMCYYILFCTIIVLTIIIALL